MHRRRLNDLRFSRIIGSTSDRIRPLSLSNQIDHINRASITSINMASNNSIIAIVLQPLSKDFSWTGDQILNAFKRAQSINITSALRQSVDSLKLVAFVKPLYIFGLVNK